MRRSCHDSESGGKKFRTSGEEEYEEGSSCSITHDVRFTSAAAPAVFQKNMASLQPRLAGPSSSPPHCLHCRMPSHNCICSPRSCSCDDNKNESGGSEAQELDNRDGTRLRPESLPSADQLSQDVEQTLIISRNSQQQQHETRKSDHETKEDTDECFKNDDEVRELAGYLDELYLPRQTVSADAALMLDLMYT